MPENPGDHQTFLPFAKEEIMDKRMTRFKHCDPRFFPYLEKVLDRLPEKVREDILNSTALQVVAGEDLHRSCALRVDFDDPVKTLLCFNPKVLFEPEHQILHTIAQEFALYVIGEEGSAKAEQKAEDLLLEWGFEMEIEAVRHCTAVSESAGYRIGYEWARKQSMDYLMQHFGLYFDEWNEKGLRRMSREQLEEVKSKAGTRVLLDDRIETGGGGEMGETEVTALPRDEAIIAGIMAAVKEIKLQEL
jgi:hypothetical protein